MALTVEQTDYLERRIRTLRSQINSSQYGWFRKAGKYRTLQGLREQLKTGIWKPFVDKTTK